MRVISCSLQNFASYKSLEFNFNDQGLCLIEGPTGSGKSTLCDAIPWCLFGRTAKGGAVDEIRSWNAGLAPTEGELILEINNKQFTIVRIRSKNANDLYYLDDTAGKVRGRDLNDTQKLINNLLGFDAELYLSGAYFHEFSQTAQFFTTTAKNRRTLCEQIVDLSLAKKLHLTTSERSKGLLSTVSVLTSEIFTLKSNITLLQRLQAAEATKVKDWEKTRSNKLVTLENQCVHFDNMKWAKIERLEDEYAKELKNDICKECGSIKVKGANHISRHKAKYATLVEEERAKENPYIEYIMSLNNEINPHLGSSKDYSDEIALKSLDLEGLEHSISVTKQEYSDLELLKDVVNDFRAVVIKNAISQLESETNELLTNHFDAEIRVIFEVEDADKLEVNITKDGNNCSYTQLSKGQRQLLKLCFGVAVMKSVSNHNGVNFGQIFFDEALDGMDDTTKTKAFGLFQTLSTQYESVFVVDHSEAIKAMFTNVHNVRLVDGASVLEKA